MSDFNPANAIVKEISGRMRALLERAEQAIGQIGDDQVWYRNHSTDNAIGNLVLHLVGNLRQWILAGIDNQADTRDRPAEFGAKVGLSKTELMKMLHDTIEESCRVIDSLPIARIAEARRIQDTDTTIAYALVSVVSHLGLHVGQIQFIAKSLLKKDFKTAWSPPEKK
jgi:hypothetical protein